MGRAKVWNFGILEGVVGGTGGLVKWKWGRRWSGFCKMEMAKAMVLDLSRRQKQRREVEEALAVGESGLF